MAPESFNARLTAALKCKSCKAVVAVAEQIKSLETGTGAKVEMISVLAENFQQELLDRGHTLRKGKVSEASTIMNLLKTDEYAVVRTHSLVGKEKRFYSSAPQHGHRSKWMNMAAVIDCLRVTMPSLHKVLLERYPKARAIPDFLEKQLKGDFKNMPD